MESFLSGCLALLVVAVASSSANAAALDPTLGPQYDVDVVAGHDTVSYSVRARGGEYTAIELTGDGDADLDVFVYDSNGRQLASGITYGSSESVTVYVRHTQTLRIVVKNCDGAASLYSLYVW